MKVVETGKLLLGTLSPTCRTGFRVPSWATGAVECEGEVEDGSRLRSPQACDPPNGPLVRGRCTQAHHRLARRPPDTSAVSAALITHTTRTTEASEVAFKVIFNCETSCERYEYVPLGTVAGGGSGHKLFFLCKT